MKIYLLAITIIFTVTLSAQEPFMENGKYGIKNESGKVLVQPTYKKIESIYSDGEYLFKGLKDGDWYLLSSSETVELSAYESIGLDLGDEDLVLCQRGSYFDVFSINTMRFITIDAKGDEVQLYEGVRDNLCAVTLKRKKGLYDLKADDFIIYPEYDQIIENDWDESMPFIAYKKKTSAIFTAQGGIVCEGLNFKIFGASYTDSTMNRFIVYSDKLKEGYVDMNREIIIRPLYDIVTVDPAYPNFIEVVTEKGHGFYWKNELILKPNYHSVRPTEHLDHVGEVNVEDVWYYVDHYGKLILKK